MARTSTLRLSRRIWTQLAILAAITVIAIAGGTLQNSSALPCRQWLRTIGREQPGKEAVQPGALRFGERRT